MRKLVSFLPIAVVLLALAAPARAQVGYGSTVAVGDDEVFIAEPANQMSPGVVYVYRRGADGWKEAVQLTRSNATEGDGFGRAIVGAGETLLVSAVNVDGGAVYLFRRDHDGWSEVGRLAAGDLAEDNLFGSALAVSDDLLIVGAAGQDKGAGAAYLFHRQSGSWMQQAKLVAEEPEAAEEEEAAEQEGEQPQAAEEGGARPALPPRFGATVAIDGNWVMVGAPLVRERAGSVYVFHRDGDSWQQVAILPGDSSRQGATFGSAIAFHDGELFIGAGGANSRVGAVYVYGYDEEAGKWRRRSSLVPFDGTAGSSFGSAIAFDGEEVLVGAPGAARQGRIYRFTRDRNGNWTSATKMATEGLGPRDRFADSLAVRGDVLVAGLPGDDYGAGTAVIMDRSDWGWARTKVLSEIKNYDPVTDGKVSCTNGKAANFGCDKVDLLSFLPVSAIGGSRGVRTNDIWGWSDPQTGKEYAIVGLSDRASFVDVTNPQRPILVGSLPKTEGAPGSVWRDIKVYKGFAFIVSDAARKHGMQVFDLSRLRQFEGTPITFTEDAHYDGIQSAHNIVINESSGFAFAVGASGGDKTCGGGLHMINIEDPRHPVFAGCFSDTSTGRRGTGYSHDAECVIYHGPDQQYRGKEICFGANETALSIADVSDKRNPVAVAMATYPNVGYTHQGWLTPDQRYFFMDDELDEIQDKVKGTRTLIWDVMDLEDPIVVDEFISTNRATDHNLYIRGDTMFQSNYVSGLRVYDVGDPEHPRALGFFDTVPYGKDEPGFGGSWSNYPFFRSGAIAVTSSREGLFLVKVQDKN